MIKAATVKVIFFFPETSLTALSTLPFFLMPPEEDGDKNNF